MENTTISKMLDDLANIKSTENESRIDLQYLIERMKPYSKNELYFFKDCIEFMLIYSESH